MIFISKHVSETVSRVSSLKTESGLLTHHSHEPPRYMIRTTDNPRCGIDESAAIYSQFDVRGQHAQQVFNIPSNRCVAKCPNNFIMLLRRNLCSPSSSNVPTCGRRQLPYGSW